MSIIEVIRHDARMDWDEHEKEQVDRIYDTPLSTAGLAHAALAKKEADLIVSSPLLRCVQSAIPSLYGRPLILDARFMEVFHPTLIGPLHEFKFRTDDELPNAFYIRTAHGLPSEEQIGIHGPADKRYREAIQDYANKGKHIKIFTHSDCIDSFAAMLGKETIYTNIGCSITGIYDGTWSFLHSTGVGFL